MVVFQQQRKSQKNVKNRRQNISVVVAKQNSKIIWNSANPAPRSTIDYKNTKLLVKFISPQGKILPRRATGLTGKQQRAMANAIKKARMSALLPFVNLETNGFSKS